ncbi:MAG: hydroxymethylbilane synthase [Candidatus Marinimicrobia bacterium]|nr:hydroxymethylbilane synthase [Candidatus Neomarinimicrobiota bacterium]
MKNITIATNEDKLAIWQTNHIKELLKSQYPQLNIRIKIIRTDDQSNNDFQLNDEIVDIPYSLEIEEQLLNNDIQLAVHNAKHLSYTIDPGLIIAGYIKRDYSEDVFVTFNDLKIDDDLPKFVVGVSNLRNFTLMKKYYPNTRLVILNGDVKSRIYKLKNFKLNGIILDKIIIKRLNVSKATAVDLEKDKFIPTAGQGATALITSGHRFDIIELLQPILDKETYNTVTAERAFISKLNINNNYPVGAYAEMNDKDLSLTAFLSNNEGDIFIKDNITKTFKNNSQSIGNKLANTFLKNDKIKKILPI